MAYDFFMIVETAHANFVCWWAFFCVCVDVSGIVVRPSIIEIFAGAVCGAGPGFRAPRARGRANLTSVLFIHRHLFLRASCSKDSTLSTLTIDLRRRADQSRMESPPGRRVLVPVTDSCDARSSSLAVPLQYHVHM